eukprot:s362_g15.t1
MFDYRRVYISKHGGNAMGSLLAGRSFFITLQSPDLEAPEPLPQSDPAPLAPLASLPPSPRMVALARRAQSTPSPGMSESNGLDLEAFFPSSFGTKMMLSSHNVMYNNLGGHGPVHSDPPVMRYHAACFQQGKPVDVVFHADPSYHPSASGLNALLGHHYSASINVAINSTLELLVELRSAQDRPLSLRRLYLSVSDTEDEESSVSSPGTVMAEDFEAVKLPSSNTWSTPSVLGEEWSSAGGASPVIFAFWNVQKVHLTLRARPKPGAVVEFHEGRSFFISMWSPDVDVPQAPALPVLAAAPLLPAGATHAATTLSTTTTLLSTTSTEALDLPESLGPWLMLRRSNVVFNNLGGRGPGHLDDRREMRFAHVAVAKAEGPVDLVLHATSSYHPGLVALNGGGGATKNGPPHAVVNVALGRSLSLDMKLVKHQQVIPVSSFWFLLMVYDVEDPFPALSSSSEVFVSGVEAMFPQSKDGQWQRVPPKANYEAFTVPPGPAPMLAVKGSVRLTLRPKSTQGRSIGALQGRSFYIALRAPELQAYSTTHPLARLAHLILPGTTTTPTTTTMPAMPPLRLGRPRRAAPQARWVRQPLIQGFLGPYLALTPSQVLVNNLAGAGPDHTATGPQWPSPAQPELRWRAGRTVNGENLEVVLRAVSSYMPQNVALNGRESTVSTVPAATVNVAMGTSVKLRFDFRKSEKQGTEISEISLPRLYVQIFDEEEPRPAMSTQGEAKVLDYEGISWPNGTWQSGGFGKTFTLPSGPAPTVAFTSCSSIAVTLHALPGRGSLLGSPWEGRTFSISLRSPDVAVPNSTAFAPGTSAAAALRHHWPPVLGGTFAGTMQVSHSGKIADLKTAAQESLGRRFLRLAAPDGRLLDPANSLQHSGLQDGDSLTAVAQQPKLAAARPAFAFWCVGADRVVTWGDQSRGGDSSKVQHQLRNVQQICGAEDAFAAILADGNVQTWGVPRSGGDSSRVQEQLRNVQQISATGLAFAAILADESVVTWGDPDCGGDSSTVQHQLRNVQQICGTYSAFAAILADGSVVTWGTSIFGGNSSGVQHQLRNVQQISSTWSAFAAILADGSVVTWGKPDSGGDSSRVQHQLRHVQQICGTYGAFAAILADGRVVTWGNPDLGGDNSRVQHQLKNVQQIYGTGHAFAAILADGSVVTWGNENFGGNSSSVQHQLRNVQQICGTSSAFAAILADGSVVTWGTSIFGGNSSGVQHQLRNVQQICGTSGAFAAILADESVVTWGHPGRGGDSSRAANASQVLRGPAAAAAAESFGSEYGIRPKSVAPPVWATTKRTTDSTSTAHTSPEPSPSPTTSQAASAAAAAAVAPVLEPASTATSTRLSTVTAANTVASMRSFTTFIATSATSTFVDGAATEPRGEESRNPKTSEAASKESQQPTKEPVRPEALPLELPPQGEPVVYGPVGRRGDQTLAVNPFWSEKVKDDTLLRSLRPQGLPSAESAGPRASSSEEDTSGELPDMRQLLAMVLQQNNQLKQELDNLRGQVEARGPYTRVESVERKPMIAGQQEVLALSNPPPERQVLALQDGKVDEIEPVMSNLSQVPQDWTELRHSSRFWDRSLRPCRILLRGFLQFLRQLVVFRVNGTVVMECHGKDYLKEVPEGISMVLDLSKGHWGHNNQEDLKGIHLSEGLGKDHLVEDLEVLDKSQGMEGALEMVRLVGDSMEVVEMDQAMEAVEYRG